MSPWSDCPIVEVRPDPEGGLAAIVPVFRGDRETAAVANSLAGLLSFGDSRSGLTVSPYVDDENSADQDDILRIAASVFYRHHKARRGHTCPKCGTTT